MHVCPTFTSTFWAWCLNERKDNFLVLLLSDWQDDEVNESKKVLGSSDVGAPHSSETYQTTNCHNPQDHTLNIRSDLFL